MKDECIMECDICKNYNIQNGFIIDGNIYCCNCIKQTNLEKLLKKLKKIKK